MPTIRIISAIGAVLLLLGSPLSGVADATPQFARQYRVNCSHCHTAPPKLNQRGENFVARGYRFTEPGQRPLRPTVPLAVWNTIDLEHRRASDTTKAFPSRIELISGGTIGTSPVSYFLEWRALSRQVGAGDRLLDRSGRFEDAFIVVPLDSAGSLTVTAGQFRGLYQVDVSRRLSISEPLAFSSGVAGPRAATSRLTSLRAFSPSGRQPGIRLAHHRPGGRNPADGWYSFVTLPLTGELTIPLADASSFEFEAHPKGVFLETFYQSGLGSVGAHVFAGRDRHLANVVVSGPVTSRLSLLAAIGLSHALEVTDARYSVGSEFFFNQYAIAGMRLDHRTRQQRDPALHLYLNSHLPFGPPGFRQALRLQLEQRVQPRNHITTLGVSHIF